jgi:hypothetical protein
MKNLTLSCEPTKPFQTLYTLTYGLFQKVVYNLVKRPLSGIFITAAGNKTKTSRDGLGSQSGLWGGWRVIASGFELTEMKLDSVVMQQAVENVVCKTPNHSYGISKSDDRPTSLLQQLFALNVTSHVLPLQILVHNLSASTIFFKKRKKNLERGSQVDLRLQQHRAAMWVFMPTA